MGPGTKTLLGLYRGPKGLTFVGHCLVGCFYWSCSHVVMLGLGSLYDDNRVVPFLRMSSCNLYFRQVSGKGFWAVIRNIDFL